MRQDLEEIKKFIHRKVEKAFLEKYQTQYSIPLAKIIEQFFDTLLFETKDRKLDGLTTRLFEPLKEIAEGSKRIQRLNNLKLISTNLEAYLRKILLLINKPKYEKLRSSNVGFHAYINELINPNKYQFYKWSPEQLKDQPFFAEFVCRAYPLRNEESHESPIWDEEEVESLIRSVLIVYVFATAEHFFSLAEITSPKNDFSNYLNKIIIQYH